MNWKASGYNMDETWYRQSLSQLGRCIKGCSVFLWTEVLALSALLMGRVGPMSERTGMRLAEDIILDLGFAEVDRKSGTVQKKREGID